MEPEYDSNPEEPSNRRVWYLTILGIAAVVGLLIGVLALTNDDDPEGDGTGETAIDAPQAYAKPDDGLDSVGLPVMVTPATGLTDGVQVAVSGTGFPANSQVGLIQCTSQSITLGQSACDMASLSYTTVNSDGEVSATFLVRRHLDVGGTPVDCGVGNVDPATWVSAQTAAEDQFTCIIGVGSISNYDLSGNSAIAFEGTVFGGPISTLPDITTTTTTYPTSNSSIRSCSEPPRDAYDDVCMGTFPHDETEDTVSPGRDDDGHVVYPTTSTSGGG